MTDGLHVAIIMDGNGRWAQARGEARTEGHKVGVEVAAKVVEAAAKDPGVHTLTLYAFSSDNWKRPHEEVTTLMGLMRQYLLDEVPRALENGVRMNVIGRRDRLEPEIVELMERAEANTADGANLLLRLAIDYSSRDALAEAAANYPGVTPSRDALQMALMDAINATETISDVDLLIRTGGEQRLSDFLLWECAYAELLFLPEYWPDFSADAFTQALANFGSRERRFGKVLT